MVETYLPLWFGFFIVVFFGLIYTLITKWVADRERKRRSLTAEEFTTAGRNLGWGLINASIVASWTWAATIMMSSRTGYLYGISGPFWYAAGATIQILLFAILAMHLKKKAPYAHSWTEFIKARFDTKTHKLMVVFAIMTNIIVTTMIVLGGAIALHELTGMNLYLAAFLVPLAFTIYTYIGGLKGSIITDYLQAVGIYVVLIILAVAAYTKFGISNIYQGLQTIPADRQMLTMASISGLMFGIINTVGNFGTVFVDQTYWHRGIAASKKVVGKAFLTGGLCWFAIPFGIATALGVTGAALNVQVSAPDAIAPATAAVVLGDVGGMLFLFMLFMAILSTGDSALNAVATIAATDVYKEYLNPNADDKTILKFSRTVALVFGIFVGILAICLFKTGIGLGWVYMAMGIFVSSAVIPITLGILWNRTTTAGAFWGTFIGMLSGIASWMVTAKLLYGEISVSTLGELEPMLAGNLAVFSVSAAICIGHSLIAGRPIDFSTISRKILPFDSSAYTEISQPTKKVVAAGTESIILKYTDGFDETHEATIKRLTKAALVLSFVLLIAWPLPMYFSGYVFGEGFFKGWVLFTLVWLIAAGAFTIGRSIYDFVKGRLYFEE